MSSASRRKDSSVVGKLLASPQAYSFFQAVRILERAGRLDGRSAGLGRSLGAGNGIGGFAPPAQELIRLQTSPSFRFPGAEVHSLERESEQNGAPRWNMRVTFMGLTGAMGVLPFHYTEMVLQRLRKKDETLAHFLDLFNHRTLSLFYRAATKYRLPLEYEKKPTLANGPASDAHTRTLLSLLGLGTGRLHNRLGVRDESLVYYGGLLTQHVRTATGLQQMLSDYFDVPVRIREFVGQWEELISDARSRLGSRTNPKGQNVQLGRSLIFGRKGWFAQSKIRICLGPLNQEQFHRFAPGTRALKALNDLVRLYVGIDKDYDFVIEVKRRDVPQKISLSKGANPLMGWNTWLSSTGEPKQYSRETLRITVSANRLK
ncbi:type VI secretion system baseplate subunit TssG [Gilvimarinus sp. F26214L]|uniref:type VI secretion system baseplate subunit TssG n=1 Tax=Gilvimarinus sp. DZF01 TaxID=3461371 RepID=UPI004045560A